MLTVFLCCGILLEDSPSDGLERTQKMKYKLLSLLSLLTLLSVSACGETSSTPTSSTPPSSTTSTGDETSTAKPDPEPKPASNATYFNSASIKAADPNILYDSATGYYYAYTTDGAQSGYRFGIYKSPDLVTWVRASDGAIPSDDPNQWGDDWFWAPECYHNEETGKYFLFYAARMRDEEKVVEHFEFADFEEACKVGVAVSDSPAGPFLNIANEPIEYYPYDPDYHDVNQIMEDQMVPPATKEEGETAPLGVYLPFIDPNVFFDGDKTYLYFSRNAYRNWVWDDDLGKYIEESNIYVVELDRDWWDDPTGTTMPHIAESYVDSNDRENSPRRRDGFVPVINYGNDKQEWENAHVDDYVTYNGGKKNRRWSEGSTTFKKTVNGKDVYYIVYSCNNYENEHYGVGYATSNSPTGPFKKYENNPIIHEIPEENMYSTGHGSFITTPENETYYVYHGRNSTTAGRTMFTSKVTMDDKTVDKDGYPVIQVDETTEDRPVPTGTEATKISLSKETLNLTQNKQEDLYVTVHNDQGALMPLENNSNKVVFTASDGLTVTADENNRYHFTVQGEKAGTYTITFEYQRIKKDGTFYAVTHKGNPLSITLDVTIA